MQPSSPPLAPSSISRFSSPSIMPESHTAAMLVLVNKPDTHSYPVFHVQKDPPPEVRAKGLDGNLIAAYDQIIIGSDYDSDLRMFFAEPKHCSLIVDNLGKIHILNFSSDNPCQLNASPLPTETLLPLGDMDVIHVAGKDFRVEYKQGYPLPAKEKAACPLVKLKTQVSPSSPKILNRSPPPDESAPYCPPARPDTPEQLHLPPDTGADDDLSNSIGSMEPNFSGLPEPSSPRAEEAAAKEVEPSQELPDLSPAPSPKRTLCPLDTADNSTASMECNTSQPSMSVKDLSTMDVSVDATERKRRISDFPKKTIASPMKLKGRKSAPVQPTRQSLRFADQNMDASTETPGKRRSPRIQSLTQEASPSHRGSPKLSTERKTPKKSSKSPEQPRATPQSAKSKSKSPLTSTSLKNVRFGPKLSPEEFDQRLPPSTPVKRGATPRSAAKAVLRRSTPYKASIPLRADLDTGRKRGSLSLSPRSTPLRSSPPSKKHPGEEKRFSLIKNLAVRSLSEKAAPAVRLQRKGFRSGVLSDISESQRFKTSARISTPTSLKEKGSRIPKPLQSGLGAKQTIDPHTLAIKLSAKGENGARNAKSPENSLKQGPKLGFSVNLDTQKKPSIPSDQVDEKESAKSPQDRASELPNQNVMTSPVSNPVPKSPDPTQKSQESSPESQTPSPKDSPHAADKTISPVSVEPLKTSKSTPSPKSPRDRPLSVKKSSPKTPVADRSSKSVGKDGTPDRPLRSSSRLSTYDPLPSTPTLRSKSPKLDRKSLTDASKSPTVSDPLTSPQANSRSIKVAKSPNTTSPSSSTKSPSPSIKSPSPGTKSPSPGIKSPSPGTKSPSPGIKSPSPGIKSPSPGTKSPSPGIKSPSPNARIESARAGSNSRLSTSTKSPLATSTSLISKYRSPKPPASTPVQDTPISTPSRTPVSKSAAPVPTSRTPAPRNANLQAGTPMSTSATPKSRPATPIPKSRTPTSRYNVSGSSRAKSLAMSPLPELIAQESIPVPRASRKSADAPLVVSPSSPVTDLRTSPRLAWQSPTPQTRSLTPHSISLTSKSGSQRVGTPRPRSTSLRNEDALVPKLFKTPRVRGRTSQPEGNFRASLFNISETETASPLQSESAQSLSKRSRSLPESNLEASENPREKNSARPEDNFNPYIFRSPRSKPPRSPQKPSEDNFDAEIFRSPPTPSFSGGRGTKRSAANQSAKIPSKVSKFGDSVSVEMSPLNIRRTRRMMREKQSASSRAVKRRSDSSSKSSPVKILILDSPILLDPEESSPPLGRRRTRSRTASVAAPFGSPLPVRITRQKTSSPPVPRRRTRSKMASLAIPVPVETSPAAVRATRQRRTAANKSAVKGNSDLIILSPAPTKRPLRSRRTAPSNPSNQTKGILKTPTKRQRFAERASPAVKLSGRHKVRTKSTRVYFAPSPPATPSEKTPPPRPPTPQKSTRRLRSQASPKSIPVTSRLK